MYALACTPAKSSGDSALLLGSGFRGAVLKLLSVLAALARSGMNKLMLRKPLGLLTGLAGVWATAEGEGGVICTSAWGSGRLGEGPSDAVGRGAVVLRLDLIGLRPPGDLGTCTP